MHILPGGKRGLAVEEGTTSILTVMKGFERARPALFRGIRIEMRKRAPNLGFIKKKKKGTINTTVLGGSMCVFRYGKNPRKRSQ